jgi:hypothetical protein
MVVLNINPRIEQIEITHGIGRFGTTWLIPAGLPLPECFNDTECDTSVTSTVTRIVLDLDPAFQVNPDPDLGF